MFGEVLLSIELFLLTIELVFLVLIWRDGTIMRDSALRTEHFSKAWYDERRAERAARQASAAKAREAKAAKSAANVVPESQPEMGASAPVGGEAGERRPEDISAA